MLPDNFLLISPHYQYKTNNQATHPSLAEKTWPTQLSFLYWMNVTNHGMGRRTTMKQWSSFLNLKIHGTLLLLFSSSNLTSHSRECLRVFCFTLINGTHYFCYSLTFQCWLSDGTIKRFIWLNHSRLKQNLIAHIISKLCILWETNTGEIGIKEWRFAIVVIEVRRSVAGEKLSH